MMRDVIAEFKALRLHGMAATWADLIKQNQGELEGSRWLIEQMLRAETTERATRSVSHQMSAAKFPVHRDLAGFDFEVSPVDKKLGVWAADVSTPGYRSQRDRSDAVCVGGVRLGRRERVVMTA